MEVQAKLGSNNLVMVFKQDSMEYMMKNVFGLRWNCKELKGIVKLRVSGIQQQNGLVNETNVTLFAKVRCFLIQSAIRFKTPVDMLGFFGWLASIKQEMLELVKVKCIFLGYHESIVGNKLWMLDDVTYRNMDFNESEEYKKTFIGAGVGMSSTQEIVDQGDSLQEVQTQNLMGYQLTRDTEQHLACELFGYREDSNDADFAVAAVDKIYAHDSLTFNNTVASMVAGKAVMTATTITKSMHQTLLEGHSILSLEGSLSWDYDVKKNGKWSCIYAVGIQEYQMVCTRLDTAFADVGSLKANLQHMEALSTTEARYVTFTKAKKKKIWLKGLLTESGYELRLVSGIVTSALVKGCSRFEVSACVKIAAYPY
uniref:RNA-directed DNA polymerase, eukaryota, reverse transcriptase zinc-binding domain protein n=1 Tax=Tanacetum cinerariifolium TaxID=118510 RepID=A0A6L2M0H0_TANCI|nr:RNA-directed DNA polymerase, eukaryota, reverse transcriptase zinc-binding domain protein [Tanacetum cinerariifolium]